MALSPQSCLRKVLLLWYLEWCRSSELRSNAQEKPREEEPKLRNIAGQKGEPSRVAASSQNYSVQRGKVTSN